MSRPETPLDVEVLVHEHVPDIDLEKHLEFTEDESNLIIEIKKFMPEGWNEIMDLVAAWDGEYDKKNRRWLIPKAAAKEPAKPKAPLTPTERTTDVKPGAEIPRFTFLPTNDILSMPFQSRIERDDPNLNELVGSMQQFGVLGPLLVRRKPSGNYELVAGHRRLAAAKEAGLKQVPCIIREMTDQEAYEAHFIENDQRKDLTDYERGRWLSQMMEKFPDEYPTQEVLAYRIGKSQQRVSALISAFQHAKQDNITSQLVMLKPAASADEIKAIAKLPEEERAEVIEEVKRQIDAGVVPTQREIRRLARPEMGPHERMEEAIKHVKQAGEELTERETAETKPEGIDTGLIFECPVCGYSATHIHYSPDNHRLQKMAIAKREPS